MECCDEDNHNIDWLKVETVSTWFCRYRGQYNSRDLGNLGRGAKDLMESKPVAWVI